MRLLVIALIGLAGCKLSEERYVDAFVEADCAYLMECTSEPVLTFLGWATEEDCRADRGPEVAAESVACDYDPEFARDCIKAIEDQACSGDDTRVFPAACDAVFTSCTDADVDTDMDTDPDTDSGL